MFKHCGNRIVEVEFCSSSRGRGGGVQVFSPSHCSLSLFNGSEQWEGLNSLIQTLKSLTSIIVWIMDESLVQHDLVHCDQRGNRSLCTGAEMRGLS